MPVLVRDANIPGHSLVCPPDRVIVGPLHIDSLELDPIGEHPYERADQAKAVLWKHENAGSCRPQHTIQLFQLYKLYIMRFGHHLCCFRKAGPGKESVEHRPPLSLLRQRG